MEYSGKLYGKVGGEYFPLMETTEDVETLKKRIAELEAETEQLRLGAVMPRFSKQDVIDCLTERDKDAFDNPYQKYEHREIQAAIEAIVRLMPPSSFPNGA